MTQKHNKQVNKNADCMCEVEMRLLNRRSTTGNKCISCKYHKLVYSALFVKKEKKKHIIYDTC